MNVSSLLQLLTSGSLFLYSPASTTQAGGKLPGASDQPMSLDKDTLKLALNAALLSCLAYKTPVQVEYLRLRANGTSQADALKVITQQVRQQ